jgi:hypothetical protein
MGLGVSRRTAMMDHAHLFAEPRVRALGDLFAKVGPIACVTRDLGRGTEELRDRFGIEH